MAEEVKATEGAAGGEEARAGKKSKKINRLSTQEITDRIEALEKGNMAGSVYYKHLLQRKRETGL
jgi:hypothetical protein